MFANSLGTVFVTCAVVATISLVCPSEGKIYDKCDLAGELLTKYKFPSSDIGNWLCLIRWESNFDTGVIGKLNADGSWDHGLFQISDKFWCDRRIVDGACGLNCAELEDDDIRDDVICAKRIYRITKFKTGNGFDAWAGWKAHCENQVLTSYTANCTLPSHST